MHKRLMFIEFILKTALKDKIVDSNITIHCYNIFIGSIIQVTHRLHIHFYADTKHV